MNNEQEKSLYASLLSYSRSDCYPFHMPGHKRRLGQMEDPYQFDITEIDGFDNLHHPTGILKEMQQRAAVLYGSKASFYLVNGSTCGILAAVAASGGELLQKRNEKKFRNQILFARNSHKAAYHALYLNRLEPVWLQPNVSEDGICRGVSPEAVRRKLEQHPQIGVVFITSPTYEGIVSPVREIAAICHQAGCILIVDEAHGAHFGFHPAWPASAVQEGADLVIQSVHKTLPALTQTALLHLCSDRVSPEMVQRQLGIYMSSSPSYVLMASIEQSVSCMEKKGYMLLSELLEAVKRFRISVKDLVWLRLLPSDDPSRILIACREGRLSGDEICDILRQQFHLEAEMSTERYVLCLLSVGDDEEGLARLADALHQIDRELVLDDMCPNRRSSALDIFRKDRETRKAAERVSAAECSTEETRQETGTAGLQESFLKHKPETVVPLRDAWDAPWRSCVLEESAGMIAAEFVYRYPPGIPLLVPGERITKELLSLLLSDRARGVSLQGMADYIMKEIRVLTIV